MKGVFINFKFLEITCVIILIVFLKGTKSQQTTPANYSIRLVGPGSTAYRGRVEVYLAGRWRTISQQFFNEPAANVTCRQLGFNDGGTPVNPAVYGLGVGYIWSYQCVGNEGSISTCLANSIDTNSTNTHNNDTGLECRTTHSEGDLRIIGDSSLRGTGFVEIYNDGIWSSICNDVWTVNNARVVCEALGYNRSDALAGARMEIKTLAWNILTKNFVLSGVNCVGTENSILNCPINMGNTNSASCNVASMVQYATVTCVPIANVPPDLPLPTLTCKNNVTASFSKLVTPSLLETHLSLAGQPCNLRKTTNATHVTLSFGYYDCGTTNTANRTHITYRNAVRYQYSVPGRTFLHLTYTIELECHIIRRVNASQCLEPVPQTIAQSAAANLEMSMQLYKGSFAEAPVLSYPVQVNLSQVLGVGLFLDTVESESTLKLVPQDCWVSPNASSTSFSLRVPLLTNKCPNQLPELAVTLYDFNRTVFGYQYNVFKYDNQSTICIHCVAIVCLTTETTGQCDRRCGTRKKRETSNSTEPTESIECRRKRETSHKKIAIRSPIIHIVNKAGESRASLQGNDQTMDTSRLIFGNSYGQIVIHGHTNKCPSLKGNSWYLSVIFFGSLFIKSFTMI